MTIIKVVKTIMAVNSTKTPDGQSTPWCVAGGSVTGQEHVRLGRNNQDGLAANLAGAPRVLVLTDGCSSGRASEVGARFGAAWLAARLPLWVKRQRQRGLTWQAVAESTTRALCRALGGLARSLHPADVIEPGTVADFFLFTFLVAVVADDATCVFGIGDGMFSINGERIVLSAGEGNAPSYTAYRLLPTLAPDVVPTVHALVPTATLKALVLGSDGAQALLPVAAGRDRWAELEQAAPTQSNPYWLERRLRVFARERGLPPLADDTSVLMLYRRSAAQDCGDGGQP
jgi:hypothetical protein